VPCGVRAGLAALAALVVAAAPAAGQQGGVADPVGNAQAIQQQLGQYRQKYAEVSAQEVDALARLDVAQRAKLVADDTFARLQSQVASALRLRNEPEPLAGRAGPKPPSFGPALPRPERTPCSLDRRSTATWVKGASVSSPPR
jgi:hypothetical protein